MLTFPKDTKQFSWTRHIKNKMVFYHLSGAQILRIFRKPDRIEEGVAENTVAAMTGRKSAQRPSPSVIPKPRDLQQGRRPHEELWIMYKMNKTKKPTSRITMISAWRYPGVTKPGERPPIPPDVAEELARLV